MFGISSMRRHRRLLIASCLLVAGASSAEDKPPVAILLAWPPSGTPYQIDYLGSIATPGDLSIRRGWLKKFGEVLAGPSGQPRALLRPFTVAVDAEGRLMVADPGTRSVHLLDSKHNKHKVLQKSPRERFRSPIGVDFDAAGNLYVSDSILGKIFVFDKDGRFVRFLGDIQGEGIFKRPTGLAVDRERNQIYLTDTTRHKVFVLDLQGKVVRQWGTRGENPGEFNYPTAVALADDRVFVLDTLNFRVQVFSREGAYLTSFGSPVNEPGGFFRPKGLAVDPKNKLVFTVDAMFELVQAFTFDGKLVLAFGHGGSGPGEFNLPAGICIQPDGRILVADSQNRRIQIFRPRAEASADVSASSRGAAGVRAIPRLPRIEKPR